MVEVFESGRKTELRKVESFVWWNPNLKVKMSEKKGTLQVFYSNKPVIGCYCKVYSQQSNGSSKFYRDGYTDITGTFRYALSELESVRRFSILCMSDSGGMINQVNPPSQSGELTYI